MSANICKGCGQEITWQTAGSHRENGCAGASLTAQPIADRLAELREQRRIALQSATLVDAAVALCVESDALGNGSPVQVKYGRALPPFRERVGVEYSFIEVIPFRDSSRGTLNTGSGISVLRVETVEEANCLCIVRSGNVVGWVTPAREWTESYAIGHGHYNSRSVTYVKKGKDAPKGAVVQIRFLRKHDTGIIEED